MSYVSHGFQNFHLELARIKTGTKQSKTRLQTHQFSIFAEMGGMGGKRGKTSVLKLITPKEIFTTKPVDNVKQAMDKEFKSIHMQTNYFNIIKKPQFDMVQYRADFYPHCDLLSAKKAFLREHKGEMGGYIFDGTCCFLARKLPFSPYEMFSKTRDGKQQKIVLKEVAVISMTNQTSVQLLNLIMRKALEGLKLQLVGRNFFDAAAKVRETLFHIFVQVFTKQFFAFRFK